MVLLKCLQLSELHFLSAPLDLILKLTTGSSARVNARVFTRVSGTRSGAHCSPFLSNSTSVCQRQSERAHTHCAPLTHSPAHTRALTHTHTHTHTQARSVGPGRRGEEKGESSGSSASNFSLRFLLVSFCLFFLHQCEDCITLLSAVFSAVPN